MDEPLLGVAYEVIGVAEKKGSGCEFILSAALPRPDRPDCRIRGRFQNVQHQQWMQGRQLMRESERCSTPNGIEFRGKGPEQIIFIKEE